MRDIQMVLERYGAWAANEGDGVYYSPIAGGFKGLLPPSGKSRPACCDDDGLIVNSAVACLKKKDPYLSMLLEWYYIYRLPLRTMADKLGISHNHVSTRLQKAEGFIDGCLAALNVPLEMDRHCQKENIYPPALKRVV
ncbi:antitermination protein [Serratia marcescens]|uniref:antiterminator Q family protein n=1 Tax=Serratia sp. CY85266 TaxID=3383697 RepID=UPI0018D8F4AB|nr:antitermination protein [Serratia marcescens]